MTEADKNALKVAALVVGTVNHIRLVKQHKQTCPDCMHLDELSIAIDLIHLYKLYA